MPSPDGGHDSQPIKAIKLRHPWRTVIAVALIVIVVLFVLDAANR